MSVRSNVSPETLSIELLEDGIAVDYADSRRVYYRGIPKKTEDSIRANPGKNVQILVTDPTETEGVLVYINDRNTHEDILKSTGVGRVMLGQDETEEVFPGVTVHTDGYATIVEADPEVARGRVFVFEEDEMGEKSYEIVSEE